MKEQHQQSLPKGHDLPHSPMNQFIEQFRDMSTEHLLERRAFGPEGLVPDAHAAIEQLLLERNVPIPPMPTRAIRTAPSESESSRSSLAKNSVLAIAALVAVAIAKQFALTWVGLLVSAGIGVYLVAEWFRRQGLSEAERKAEDEEKQAERDGLTDLMKGAAVGDLARVNELLEYNVKVNAISAIGSTALMYAAKNGHSEIVARLLQAGADPSLQTQKGRSALDLARNAGQESTVQLLLSSNAR